MAAVSHLAKGDLLDLPPPVQVMVFNQYNGAELVQKDTGILGIPITAITVLGKARMIGYFCTQPQPTKPAVGQMEIHFLAESAF